MGISRMETRSFDSLMGRTIALIPGDGETYRFIFESIFGPSAVLKPVDLKSTAYAKAVEQKVVVPIEASIDGGKAMAEVTVERWSERTGALRVYRPKEVVLEQRRRDRRLSVRFPLELGVMRDGELRTVRTITEDVSVGGFAAVVDEQLVPGELMVVLVQLPGRSLMVTARVTIVERARRRTMHSKITAISPDDAAALASALQVIEAAKAAEEDQRT
jgi:hypothetical protein